MSHLEQLSIQGIRSFNPDVSAVIKFHSPVTMILGSNGSGKTTVIEAIKFAITGEFPPGADKGKAFVHDTHMAHKQEVDAKVVLGMTNVHGKSLRVFRHIRLTQTATKKTFKTVKADIVYKKRPLPQDDEHEHDSDRYNRTNISVLYDAEEGSVSRRCVDTDAEMVRHLGVSAAVANLVIFCHQEEANWPLSSDPASLKEKFDLIFSAERYSKALENIKKIKKAQTLQRNDSLVDLERAKAQKKLVSKLRADIARHSLSMGDIDTQIVEVDDDIAPHRDELKHLETQLRKADALTHSIDAEDRLLKQLSEQIDSMEKTVEVRKQESNDELKDFIERNNKELDMRKRGTEQLDRDIKDHTKELRGLEDSKDGLRDQISQVNTEITNHKSSLDKRDVQITNLLQHLNLPNLVIDSHAYTKEQRESIIDQIDGTIKSIQSNIQSVVQSHKEREAALSIQRKGIESELETARLQISYKTQKVKEKTQERIKKNMELSDAMRQINVILHGIASTNHLDPNPKSGNAYGGHLDHEKIMHRDSPHQIDASSIEGLVDGQNPGSMHAGPGVFNIDETLFNIQLKIDQIDSTCNKITKEDSSFFDFQRSLVFTDDLPRSSSPSQAHERPTLPQIDTEEDMRALFKDVTQSMGNLKYVEEKKKLLESVLKKVDEGLSGVNAEMQLLNLQNDKRSQIAELERSYAELLNEERKTLADLKNNSSFLDHIKSYYEYLKETLDLNDKGSYLKKIEKLLYTDFLLLAENSQHNEAIGQGKSAAAAAPPPAAPPQPPFEDPLDRFNYFEFISFFKKIVDHQSSMLEKDQDALNHCHSKVFSLEETILDLNNRIKREIDETEDKKTKLTQVCNSSASSDDLFATSPRSVNDDNGDAFETSKTDFSDYIAVLENSREAYEDILNELKMLESGQLFYQRFKKTADAKKCCPLCDADFTSDPGSLRAFREKIQTKLDKVPQRLDELRKVREVREKKMYALSNSRGLFDEISEKSHYIIPDLKEKLKLTKQELSQRKADEQSLKERVVCLKSTLSECWGFLSALEKLEDMHQGLKSKRLKIQNESKGLHHASKYATISECLKVADSEKNKKDQLTIKINEFSETIIDLNKKLSQLQAQKAKLTSDANHLRTCRTSQTSLNEDIDFLTGHIAEFEAEIVNLEKTVPNLKRDLEQIDKKNSILQLEHNDLLQKKQEYFRKSVLEREKLTEHFIKIEETARKDLPAQLKVLTDQLGHLTSTISLRLEEKDRLDEELRSIKIIEEKTKQENKILEANIALNDLSRGYTAKANTIEELKTELKGYDLRSLEKARRFAEQQFQALQMKKQQLIGSKQQLQHILKGLDAELNQKELREAEGLFNEKEIAAKALKYINDDLDLFYKALDKSIMLYHKMKMDEINKIIKEMWVNTYAGSDIDTIEIRSEVAAPTNPIVPIPGARGRGANAATAAAAAAKQQSIPLDNTAMRKNYNYKVVMMKGSAELDMRGRCSAGQKVLASIIIRLALAETFCANCGILALDEPTSNLDHDNIERLALSLANLINMRRTSTRFQLLIITHDEDFVNLLARNGCLEKYWLVSRDERQFTRLREQTCHYSS